MHKRERCGHCLGHREVTENVAQTQLRNKNRINKTKSKTNDRSTFPPSSEQVSGSVLYPQSNPLL